MFVSKVIPAVLALGLLGSTSFAKDKTAKISRDVKVEVCKGPAIQFAVADFVEFTPQKDAFVKAIRLADDDTVKAGQAKYYVTLTEENDRDFYNYEVRLELSAMASQCRLVQLDAIPNH